MMALICDGYEKEIARLNAEENPHVTCDFDEQRRSTVCASKLSQSSSPNKLRAFLQLEKEQFDVVGKVNDDKKPK